MSSRFICPPCPSPVCGEVVVVALATLATRIAAAQPAGVGSARSPASATMTEPTP